jgi:hypothetical protein
MSDEKKLEKLRDGENKIIRDRDDSGLGQKEEFDFEKSFVKAFNNSPIAMSISTLDKGWLVSVNRSFLEAIGYRKNS